MQRKLHSKPFTFSPLLIILAISMASLISLYLLFLSLSSATALRHHYHSPNIKPHLPNPSASSSPSLPQIRLACKATRFPDSCESALSQSPNLPPSPTPLNLIIAAISSSSRGVATASSTAHSILSSSASNPNRSNAARNCIEQLSYSDRRLSLTQSLTRGATKDSRAWASAALLYQYDCWSALKYVNDTHQVDDAMRFLASLTDLTSNALSMIFSYDRFANQTDLWAPPQTERDGFWGDSAGFGSSLGIRGGFPSGLAPDATVCKDGNGCYRTVQEAVDAAPEYGAGHFVIHIKEGVYVETVRVPYEKTNVVFLGDGMGKTVITGSLNAQMVGVSTYNTATVGVNGDGFMARDLTFENTAGPDAHQAVAFRSDSDLSILESVEFLGHQDTLYAHSLRQFYKSCRISGTVDFIFGNSAAVFQDSIILVLPRQLNPEKGETNAVSAHGRTDPAQSTGFVFHNCSVTGSADYLPLYWQKPAAHKNYLGRPWKEYSRTVYIDCYLDAIIRPEGWLPWNGEFALSTLFYGEFQSSGPGANATTRVAWSNQIPAEHVTVYSVQNFIQGDEWIPTS